MTRAIPVFCVVCALVGVMLTGCGGPSRQTANEAAAGFCAIHRGLKKIDYEGSAGIYRSSFTAECNDGSELEE